MAKKKSKKNNINFKKLFFRFGINVLFFNNISNMVYN